MRSTSLGLTLVASVFALGGCGGSSEIKAAGMTLDIGDQAYFSFTGADACPAGGTGQLLLDFVDFNYLCDPNHPSGRSTNSAHVELQVIVTIGQPPDYAQHYPTLAPYEVGTADCKNGPTMAAIGEMLHYPAGSTSPDRTVQADSGSVTFSQFDPAKMKQLKGHFELHFGGDTVKQDFALDSCN